MTTSKKNQTPSGFIFCSKAYHKYLKWYPLTQEDKGDLLDILDNYYLTGEVPNVGDCKAYIGAIFDEMKYAIDSGLASHKHKCDMRDQYNEKRKQDKNQKECDNQDNSALDNISEHNSKVNQTDNNTRINNPDTWHYDEYNNTFVNTGTGEIKDYLPSGAICDNKEDIPTGDGDLPF